MVSKPRLQPSGLPALETQTVSERTQVPETEWESYGTTPPSHGALRSMDAAWFFELAPDAMVLVDRAGRIALVNSKTEKIFGYGREELIGEPVEKLMPERFRDGHTEHRSRYSEAPYARPMGKGPELFGRHRDGHEFPIQINLAPLETEDGVMVSSAIRDVTDLKRTQELQSSLEFERLMSRLSKTFVNVPVERIDSELNSGLQDLAEAMDLDRILIDLTVPDKKSRNVIHWWVRAGLPAPPLQSIRELFPWLASRIANREMCCVSGPEDLPEAAAAEREYMLAEGIKSCLAIPLVVGGEQFGMMVTTLFRRQQTWDSQSISRFQQAGDIFANVFARRLTTEAQRESEERFRTVANTAPVLIWMSGTNKLCTFVNQGWLAFTGRTMEEEMGNGWVLGIHPADRDRCLESYSAEFDARSEFTLEYRLRSHDGNYRWIVNRGVPRFDSGGRFLGYIGSCIDITDRKLSEQALAEQLKFETVLGELLTAFVNLSPSQLDAQIIEAQKRICETLGLDRSTLGQVTVEGDDLIITHSWAAEGFKVGRRLSKREFPWVMQMLLDGRPLKFARIDDLPEEAAKDKETLGQNGLKSFVAFPLSARGEMIGGVAFISCRAEREWPAPLVQQLAVAAQVFANALSRARADKNLSQAYNQIEELKQQIEKENIYLREKVNLEHHHDEVIGDSAGIRRVLKKVEQVAPTDSTALLLGETGTGKELIARTIHAHSRRSARVMVKVNCATLPASLIESELFGREKGAFTGALTREVGRFELAHGSTILLDEVGELPIELQAKLLRVLQEGEFERLGCPKTIKVDVRVIAATSKNLQQAVRDGKFREDLYYRLNVFPITIPPLRERREDIPALVWHFVNDLSQRMGRSIETIQGSTMEAFKSYYWPGNIRELRNVIERFLITSTNTVFRAKLPTEETAGASAHTQTFEEAERTHILHVMELTGWRIRGEGCAAQILGLKPTTLESRMKKLGISRHR
jgi:formate hydrogenlyase transcriptional activator